MDDSDQYSIQERPGRVRASTLNVKGIRSGHTLKFGLDSQVQGRSGSMTPLAEQDHGSNLI